MPNPLNVPITPPRVAFIDPRTGTVSREWYMFFLSLFQLVGGSNLSLVDLQKGPPTLTIDEINAAVAKASENLRPSTESAIEQIEELRKQIDGLAEQPVGVLDKVAELRKQIDGLAEQPVGVLDQVAELRKQIEALELQVQPELGTFAALQQANLSWTTFDTTPQSVPDTDTGTVYWSEDDATLNVTLENGVTGQVCQQLDFHPKNTSGVQIDKGQAVMATGVVGSSTKITCAKAVADGSIPAQYMLGIAAEDIPANSFGYVVWFGSVRGFNTTGANKTVPETWVDGDVLYFDPVYPGELTKVEPFAPNLDLPIAIVTSVGNNGSIFVRMKTGESLDELHDVHAPTPAAGDVLVWDAVDGRWENFPASSLPTGAATNLAGGVAGSVPYQSAPSATTFLSIGAANTVMTSSGTAPQWSNSLTLAGTLAVNGNTTLGDATTDAVTVNGYIGIGGAGGSNKGIYQRNTALTGTTQYGITTEGTFNSSATSGCVGFASSFATQAAAFTTTTAVGFRAFNITLGAGSAITNQYGVLVDDQTRGTNNFGVAASVSSGSNKWNIYASGTAANYFAGVVQFAAGSVSAPALTRFGDTNTGIYFPAADTIAFTEGGVESLRLDASANVRVGTAALATTATNGFLYIPTCAGTPTGVPTAITGLAPLVIDSTNNKLYFYSGGAWRDAGP